MRRPLCTERRHPHLVHCATLALVILTGSGFASIAGAVPPVFQGWFSHHTLCSPRGIGVSPSGDVFVGSDCQNPHLVRFTAAGTFVTSWFFPAGYLGPPNGVTLDGSGNVFVTDGNGHRVYKLTNAGALLASWAFTQPNDVAVDGSGSVVVTGNISFGGLVQKFTNDGEFLATIGSTGSGPGQYQFPSGIGVDAGGRIYVADYIRLRILRFLSDGSFDMEFATTAPPTDVAVGPDGLVYVIRSDLNEIYQYSPSGELLSTFSSPSPFGMLQAFRIAIHSTGEIFILEQQGNKVTKFQIDQPVPLKFTTFGGLKAMYR